MPNYNVGIVVQAGPDRQRLRRLCDVIQSGRRRIRRHRRRTMAAAPVLNGNPNQVFGPEKNTAIEVGTKWELFDRHLLVTAALFQTDKENARESRNIATQGGNRELPLSGGRRRRVLHPRGAAYRIRGIDLGVAGKITDKWSIFGGLVLMQSAVTKSLVPRHAAALSTNVGLPLANIAHQSFNLLTKYQFTDIWEMGGQATYGSQIYGGTFLAANQGTSLPRIGASTPSSKPRSAKNWTREAVRQQHLQQALLRRALSERDAVRARSAGPQLATGASARYLNGGVEPLPNADLCPRRPEQGRCGGFPPHHGWLPRGRMAALPPGRSRRMVKKNEQLPPDSETARQARPPRHLRADGKSAASSRRRFRCIFFRRCSTAMRRPTATISASMSTMRCAGTI